MSDGVSIATVAYRRVSAALDQENLPLPQLVVGALADVDGSKAEMREAIAWLCAQLRAERRVSDHKAHADARLALHLVGMAVDEWRASEARRSTKAEPTNVQEGATA